MDATPTPPAPATPPPPRHRPPWLTSLLLVVVPAAGIVAALGLVFAWLIGTAAGLRTVLWAAAWAVPSLQATDVDGSLRDGFSVGRLVIDEPRWGIDLSGLAVTPQHIDWTQRSLDLANVSARSAAVTWTTSATRTPNEPPASLALPLTLRLRNVSVGELRVGERGQPPQVLRDVRLQGEADAQSIRIASASARYGATAIALRGTLGAARPFPLDAHAEVRSVVLDQSVQATADATGSLLDMRITAHSDNAAGRVDGVAQVTPFADIPLAALSLTVEGLQVEKWLPALPAMRLDGVADLKPQAGPDFALAGPFRLANAVAGPVDRGRIPVQSARGSLRWSAAALDLALEQVEGAGGSARAGVVRAADGALTAKVNFNGIDASRIHTALTATRATGQLDYTLDQGRQRFSGRASNAGGVSLDINFAAAFADQVLDIQRAVARVGDGRADVSGRVQFGNATVARLRGEFRALDLGKFVRDVDARVNGSFDVDGQLQPVRRGRADVTLTDSRIYGRAVDGRASVRLDGDAFDVDTALTSGTAELRAKGGLGGGRELAFSLSAPRAEDLLPAVRGAVTAEGTVGGSMNAPTLAVTASAARLVLPGDQRIEKLDAAVRGGLAAEAPLDVNVTLAGHRAPNRPELSLASANLPARGTTAAHAIELDAATATQQPLSLRAKGGWQEDAWRGTLTSLLAGLPLDLRLDTDTPVTLARERIAIGPTRFVARDTQLEGVEFVRADGRWRSAGTFSHLQPQAFDPRARAPRRAVRSSDAGPQPLTLSGRWSLELTEALNGVVVIERTGGDLYGGVDAVHPIGISDIGAALSIVENRVTGTAYLRGGTLGKVDAAIDAFLDTDGMRLAQNRALRVAIDADLPDLGWLGPLIGDTVQIQGAATVHAVVGGTPANPTADGQVRGRDLRLVWIEQGLRLENGTLDAGLEDGVLVLNEMIFRGEPRVVPDEKRALGALTSGQPGTLRVVGRIALQSLTGSIGITAEKLPILQRRDRWMVVSGEGGITLTPTRAELYAKPVVDGAYIDFAVRGPRSLPNDVVVVRAEEPQRPKDAAPPLAVTINVDARLGQRFYIRGAGLEARLAGGVNVTGRPTRLQAVGVVRIVDGIFNGYGQRLQIERGLVTFSGPLENPALNVLAIRTGLPVEVGVQITGTALAPVVRLHSDTAMSDVEKLNWLVLGRSAGSSDGQERALLTAAASALFAGQTDGAAANLLRSFGIDEFGIRSGGQNSASLLPRETVAGTLRSRTSGTTTTEFVALGKRLTDDMYVTFEQALSGAEFFATLNYQLTRRLTLALRAGSTSAISLVYSLAFNDWSEMFSPAPPPRGQRRAATPAADRATTPAPATTPSSPPAR